MQFSVIVPCHNAATSIGQTLQSIAAQTYQPLEIIVVNDASTDDSRAQIVASGVDVTLLEVEFLDSGKARNLAIERARGDGWRCAMPTIFGFRIICNRPRKFLAGGEDVAYMANHDLLNAQGQRPLPDSMAHKIVDSGGGRTGAQWLDILVNGFHFGHSSVIYRREYVSAIGGFDLSFERQEDLDLWLRAISGGTWAYGAQSAMAYRTDTPGSMTKAVIKSARFNVRALLKNRAHFPGEAMQILIARNSRHALSLAFVDGTRADFRAAWRLARAPYFAENCACFIFWPLCFVRSRAARFASSGAGSGAGRAMSARDVMSSRAS